MSFFEVSIVLVVVPWLLTVHCQDRGISAESSHAAFWVLFVHLFCWQRVWSCLFCFLQHFVFCSYFNEFRNRDKILQVVMCVGEEFTLRWILSACDLMCYWLHCAFYCLRVDHDMYYPGHPYMYHHGMSKLLCDYLLSCLACWGGVVGPGGWIIVLVYEM